MNASAVRQIIDHFVRSSSTGTGDQRRHQQDTRRAASLCMMALFVLGIGGWFLQRETAMRGTTAVELATIRQTTSARSEANTSNSGGEPIVDFTAMLPIVPRANELLTALQRESTDAGVILGAVQIQPMPAAPAEQLPHASLAVSLRGSYPKLKSVLADVLARYPSVTVHRLSLRRLGSPQEVEASVTLIAWARPAASAGSSSNRGP